MKSCMRHVLPCAATVLLAFVCVSHDAFASTRVVSSQCSSSTTVTYCYTTVGAAVTAAVAGDDIEIHPGTYSGNILINKNIASVYGTETAATFLASGNSGAALTLTGVTGINIRNLTFINSTTGIYASSSPSLEIRNNVFQVGMSSAAIQLVNSSSAQIVNNTFHLNANGILSDIAAVAVKNNIFSNQSTAIQSNILIDNILNNLFSSCSTIGPSIDFAAGGSNYKGNLRDSDPLFVNPGIYDFHLRSGSPCIDTGSTSAGADSVDGTTADIGAYGGSEADTTPFPVQNIVVTRPTDSSLSVSWSQNPAYTVKGYKIYYGTASGVYGGTGAAEGDSPISVLTSTATSTSLSGLASAVTPSDPTARGTAPRNTALLLTWDGAAGATGYRIYHDTNPFTQSTLPANPVTIGNATSYTLTGLTNGVPYYTAVSATAQRIYYVAVTAIDGNQHESDYSHEASGGAGDIKESNVSLFSADYPEALVPYPNLPDRKNGCFIATAAYGNYSDPAVKSLRLFRDRCLMTNRAGRAFVGWYYDHSPAAAAWLDHHPDCKPVVRVLLLPLSGVAFLMTTPAFAGGIGAVLLCAAVSCLLRRRAHLRKGGLN